ncbi:hypothetical protein LY11_00579 [Pedobacter cryoconitis]|uniref:Uncharacterized protein n=2 Tax=Pedobacter cryoconitis TaxID=188932 RepID=A0A327T8Y7_9SPHI|nr:hypothetical protein LY11_00579 [Pedobacter cryoconitis]
MTAVEINQQLSQLVQNPSLLEKADKEYYGTITADEFKITRAQGANRSSFYPVITGHISSAQTGSPRTQTEIILTFRVHKLFRALFWFPLANFIITLADIAYNTISGTNPENAGWDYFLTVLGVSPLFILLLLLLPRIFGFFSSTTNSIAQFRKIWKAEEIPA